MKIVEAELQRTPVTLGRRWRACASWLFAYSGCIPKLKLKVGQQNTKQKMDQNAMCKMPSPMIHAPIKTCQEEGTHIASKPVIWKIDSFIQVQYSSLQHLTPCTKQSPDTNKCEILCRAMRKCLAALPVVSVAQVGVAIGGGSTWKPSICDGGTFRKLVNEISFFPIFRSLAQTAVQDTSFCCGFRWTKSQN